MSGIAVVTGADRGLGLALTSNLLSQGWKVFAGQFMSDWAELDGLVRRYPDHLTVVPLDVSSQSSAKDAAQAVRQETDRVDMIINNAGINALHRDRTIRESQDYEEIHKVYDINSLGPLRVVEAFLQLTDQSEMKRLCFVSSEAGSIARAHRPAWFGYSMSKAALNMGVRILFNYLRPEGYMFRLYHPGGIRSYIGGTGVKGTRSGQEPEEAAIPALAHFLENNEHPTAEDHLIMMDHRGQEWPW
jgi:NAD(P)-dependent dehydrogenase (short-subunit alcohol dehydrogenase family)